MVFTCVLLLDLWPCEFDVILMMVVDMGRMSLGVLMGLGIRATDLILPSLMFMLQSQGAILRDN